MKHEPVNVLEVCAGISAVSAAWGTLGAVPLAFSEIEPFPCDLLREKHPGVPNLGDMTRFSEWPDDLLVRTDVLAGGTPCQAFSVAGQRESLNDERGNLTLLYVHILDHIDALRHAGGRPPAVCFWENVPGVLNTHDNAFGCFLGGLAGSDGALRPPGGQWLDAGYVRGPRRSIAWRVLNAEYFGVAQRRRRLFLVASAGAGGICPAEVLFERGGLRRDTAPRREKGEIAPTLPARRAGGGGLGTDFDCDGGLSVEEVAWALQERDSSTKDGHLIPEVVGPLVTSHTPRGHGAAGVNNQAVQSGHIIPEVVPALLAQGNVTGGHRPPGTTVDTCLSLLPEVMAFPAQMSGTQAASTENVSPVLQGKNPLAVRRLTPRECERLQGFPDDYTLVDHRGKPAADGPRYKALGNSMAVPVVAWIGRRLLPAVRETLSVSMPPIPAAEIIKEMRRGGSYADAVARLRARDDKERENS